MFKCYLRVRYLECDPQGIVFNGRYVDYIDVAMTEYFRSALDGGYDYITSLGLETVVVNVEVSWKASARADEIIMIQIPTPELGNSSINFCPSFYRENGEEKIAEAKISYVCVDAVSRTKRSIPEPLANKIRGSLGNTSCDLTGTKN